MTDPATTRIVFVVTAKAPEIWGHPQCVERPRVTDALHLRTSLSLDVVQAYEAVSEQPHTKGNLLLSALSRKQLAPMTPILKSPWTVDSIQYRVLAHKYIFQGRSSLARLLVASVAREGQVHSCGVLAPRTVIRIWSCQLFLPEGLVALDDEDNDSGLPYPKDR